jgi:hypothetical protein
LVRTTPAVRNTSGLTPCRRHIIDRLKLVFSDKAAHELGMSPKLEVVGFLAGEVDGGRTEQRRLTFIMK